MKGYEMDNYSYSDKQTTVAETAIDRPSARARGARLSPSPSLALHDRTSHTRVWLALALLLAVVERVGTAAADDSSSSSSSSGSGSGGPPRSAVVHSTWSPAIVVVSYLIAVLGSFTSLQVRTVGAWK